MEGSTSDDLLSLKLLTEAYSTTGTNISSIKNQGWAKVIPVNKFFQLKMANKNTNKPRCKAGFSLRLPNRRETIFAVINYYSFTPIYYTLNDILIIGGGLAGLTNAILLAKNGLKVSLVEKKQYPFHRVCGEYVSNEALPFLRSMGIDPFAAGASAITNFILSQANGQTFETGLDMGGFGLSRYVLDELLHQEAVRLGVKFYLKTSVNDFNFQDIDDAFDVALSDGDHIKSKIVIGSFGKRSTLDRQLDRAFMKKRSPYIGVKYHIKADFPPDTIALHIFKDGYCGINSIEDGKLCLCYLTTRENLKKSGTIPQMETMILRANPYLDNIFKSAEVLYDKPEVINEISFLQKETVTHHALMCGDAAGMIAPLCGNGMAMAVHAAKICSEEVVEYFKINNNRSLMEKRYSTRWNKMFASRLTRGRLIQKLFHQPLLIDATIGLTNTIPAVGRILISQTHGDVF
jgi:flavin-dependent dehydrogenase